MDRTSADERGLVDVAQRHDQAEGRGGVGQRDHARHVTQRTIEPELPAEGEALRARRTQLTGGDEEPHGDREIESGAAFSQPRRRKVDDRPTERPREAAGQQRGTDTISSLSHRGVREPHNGEAGEAVGDMDLNGNGSANGTVQRGRGHGGKHDRERSVPCDLLPSQITDLLYGIRREVSGYVERMIAGLDQPTQTR